MQLVERLSGYDQTLLDLAGALVSESSADYPNGPFFWNEIAHDFIDGLVARHTSGVDVRARGMLANMVVNPGFFRTELLTEEVDELHQTVRRGL